MLHSPKSMLKPLSQMFIAFLALVGTRDLLHKYFFVGLRPASLRDALAFANTHEAREAQRKTFARSLR
ncbi:hypothetical protein FACHB389_19435 [Nostoc calcicola FACHB-389]|nr:hypothetical protein FACHB389_19435 [Nostoc calcicola FACHB-389]